MNKMIKGMAVLVMAMMSSVAVAVESIEVTSTAFTNHANVPLKYTAYGDNVSPQIKWGELPAGTEQLALIMDDPIAPTPEPFVHWVVYNIPATASELPEGMSSDERVSEPASLAGAINGINGLNRVGHFGPRPPVDGELHAYHYKVYALDSALDLEPGLDKPALLAAIEDHIIGVGMIMGHYERTE